MIFKKKEFKVISSGFDVNLSEINDKLFDYQKVIVKWALKEENLQYLQTLV